MRRTGTKAELLDPPRPVGGFYRLDATLRLMRLPLLAPSVANSIAFNATGTTLYFCDSPARESHCCGCDADGGINAQRLFVRLRGRCATISWQAAYS